MTVLRDGYRVPFRDSPPPLSRTPCIVSDVLDRLSSGSSLAARVRGDACQRSLRNRPRSGSRLLQSPLPGGEGIWRLETRDRPLSPERVRPADSVQDGNSRFYTVICQRGGFSSFLGSEARILSDPDPLIFEEAIEVHVGGDGLPVPSPVFRTVNCSPGLHQGFRSSVSVGTLSRDQTSPLSGRLVGSLLLGAGSQTGRPVASLALSHPRDCDKREVGSRALADCEVSRHDHRYRGKVYPSLARVKKFLMVAESFCTMDAPPAQLWQVILGHLASLERLVPHGRLRMRTLQWHLKAHWSPESDPPSLPVPLPQEVRRDLHLYSDASCSGWGAHLRNQHVSGVWSDQEKLLHINLLEMKALFLGLQAFREDVIGHHMTAMCDNSTVVAYLNKQGGTVSRALCLLASRLLRWTESFDIHLDARSLPGQANVLADVLSRRGQVVGTEWSLHPQVARSLLCFLGQSVD